MAQNTGRAAEIKTVPAQPRSQRRMSHLSSSSRFSAMPHRAVRSITAGSPGRMYDMSLPVLAEKKPTTTKAHTSRKRLSESLLNAPRFQMFRPALNRNRVHGAMSAGSTYRKKNQTSSRPCIARVPRKRAKCSSMTN